MVQQHARHMGLRIGEALQQQARRRLAQRAHRLGDRAQARIDLRGDIDVVETNDGDVFRHALAELAQTTQHADRQGVRDGENGRRCIRLRHHFQHRLRAGRVIEAGHGASPARIGRDASAGQRIEIAALALPRIRKTPVGIDQADAPVAAFQQMPDRVRRGAVIVDADIRHGHRRVEFAAGDPWQAGRLMRQRMLDRVRVEADGAVGAAHAQQIEIRALTALVGAGVAQQHKIAVVARHRIDAADDLRIKRVADVGHHRQQHAAFGGAQATRQMVHAVAERVHGGQHLGARGRTHAALLVHHARDGGDRHAGVHGDGADRSHCVRRGKMREKWLHGYLANKCNRLHL